MALYRHFFPKASILPKLHFLEDHIYEWVRRYRTGVGLLGEQGIESIHHDEVNELNRTYSCIRNRVDRLKCVMEEQHRRCHPDNVSKIPQKQKRKKPTEECKYRFLYYIYV